MSKGKIVVDIADLRKLLQEEVKDAMDKRLAVFERKLERVEKRLQKHTDPFGPYIDGLHTVEAVLRFFKWIFGIGLLFVTFYAAIRTAFPKIYLPW